MVIIDLHAKLGNQLFQIAAAEALAKQNNTFVFMRPWDNADLFCYEQKKRLEYGESAEPLFVYNYGLEQFHYKAIPYFPNIKLNGYFQSYKYFTYQEKHIRKIFTLSDRYRFAKRDLCFVHIRRGDYLQLPLYHPVLPLEYYRGAVATILSQSPNKQFMVFSDDPDWCEDNLEAMDLPSNTDVSRNDVKTDFATMISCDSGIIANSSLSWWAGWLSQGKIIAPNPFHRWFGPGYSHYKMNDLIPSNWEIV